MIRVSSLLRTIERTNKQACYGLFVSERCSALIISFWKRSHSELKLYQRSAALRVVVQRSAALFVFSLVLSFSQKERTWSAALRSISALVRRAALKEDHQRCVALLSLRWRF